MVGIWIHHVGRQHLPEQLPIEDVDAHRSQVAFRLRRLFLKFDDPLFLIRVHDAEAACFLHRHRTHSNGHIGIALNVV